MPRLAGAPAERLAQYFVDYLFHNYRGSRHVRRVASWVGLIVLGIERLAGTTWRISPKRQLVFRHGAAKYKAKYEHHAGPRGGIAIVEIRPGRGSPEGRGVTTIRNLREAEAFYTARVRRDPWP